ncbi:MAG: PRC-barrel domain-containing protein [Anaerolineales bacterium]|nr:PRC-barrel domain-containing protein [Anaerolineales bacterium]
MNRTMSALSASTLIGDDVYNRNNEKLGQLNEIMLDVGSGRVAYAVLSFGGFLGLGDKLFAIPWDALTLDPDAHAFILNVDKETLENAPGFDKNNWPKTVNGDDTWLVDVYEHYGYSPYWRQGF